jgi:hypothetical protein
MKLTEGCHDGRLHGSKWLDCFWSDAVRLREELLNFRDWRFMSVLGEGEQYINYSLARINGLTTGLLSDKVVTPLPRSSEFIQFMRESSGDISEMMIGRRIAFDVQCSGRIYGKGGWLSEHTDFVADRAIAWILYLTDPLHGEWTREMGGALELFAPGVKESVVIHPRFNRLALFNVSPESWHRVSEINFGDSWADGRLALSGWFVHRKKTGGVRVVYKKSNNTDVELEVIQKSLQGEAASIQLQLQYQKFNNADTSTIDHLLRLLEKKWDAHRNSPAGYYLVKFEESEIDSVELIA